MSPTAASPRRRRPVTGVAVAIGIALTTVVVATGAAGNAGPVPTRSAGPPPVSSIVESTSASALSVVCTPSSAARAVAKIGS